MRGSRSTSSLCTTAAGGGSSSSGGTGEETNIGCERHRDAVPDDGSEMMGQEQQGDHMRRVTAVAYTTEHWPEEEHGGRLHLFLMPHT